MESHRRSVSFLGEGRILSGSLVCLLSGVALILAVTCLFSPVQAATTIPFESDFESPDFTTGFLVSDPDWLFNSAVSNVEVIDADAASGSQSLLLEGASTFTLSADGIADGSVRWVDFFLKPVFAEVDDLPVEILTTQSAVTGFLKVATEGEVYAIDGDGLSGGEWVPSGSLATLNGDVATDWIRLTYRLDYGMKQWDLFVDGQMALTDLGFFDDSADRLAEFSVRADANNAAGFDYFYAGDENPLYLDTANDGLPDSWVSAQGLNVFDNQRLSDPDLDGLNNLLEYQLSTQAFSADTDGDGVHDGAERLSGANPSVFDTYSLSLLPFAEDFESYTTGSLGVQGNWVVIGENVMVQSAVVGSGALSLNVGAASSVSNAINGSSQQVVWLDLYIKPTSSAESPTIDAGSSIAYYFDKDGRPVVFDGSGGDGSGFWKLLDAAKSNDWRRVTVKADYGAQAYDFYLDGERLGAGVGFANTQPYLSHFSVSGSSFIDDLSIVVEEPVELDDDRDGSSNAEEIIAGTNSQIFDSDGDGLADSLEAVWGLDPLVFDSGLTGLAETDLDSGIFEWSTAFSAGEGYIETSLDGQQGWSANGDILVAAEQVDVTDSITEDTAFERVVGVGDTRRVWISFRAKMVAGELPDLTGLTEPAVAIFCAATSSTISVWDEVNQFWAEFNVNTDVTQWNSYTLYFDYVEQEWLLTQNGILFASGLSFSDEDLVVFSRFKALQGRVPESDVAAERSVASFDDFKFSNFEPEGLDFDGDGLINSLEREVGSNLLSADTDGDGMDDAWELSNGLDLSSADDGNSDVDEDGRTLIQEYAAGTDPALADADGDGADDLFEYVFGSDPFVFDEPIASSELNGWGLDSISSSLAKAVAVSEGYSLLSNGTGFSTHRNDSVGFLYNQVEGDFEFVSKVEFPDQSSNTWRAGILLRESVSPTSAMVGVFISPNGSVYQYDRGELGGKERSVGDGILKVSMPGWVKVKRHGGHVTVFTSIDGQSWDLFYTTTLSLPDFTLCGFAVISGSSEEVAGARFSNFSFDLDEDADGILASVEALQGSSDVTSDSDSDGVSDYREQYEFYSDPLNADLGDIVTVQEIRGRDSIIRDGEWIGFGDGRYADTIRGVLEFPVNVSEAGILQLAVEAGFAVNETHDPIFDIDVDVDGEYVGTLTFDVNDNGVELSEQLLPWLGAGDHLIRLSITNTYWFRKIRIQSLKLQSIGGLDSDGDGIPDWASTRIDQINGVSLPSVESQASPVCIIGSALFPSFTKVDDTIVAPGPDYQWFMDVNLADTNPTQIQVSHENGARVSDFEVSWVETNVLSAASLTIRKGDALKFVAQDIGFDPLVDSTILIDDAVVFEGPSSEFVTHQFNEVGTFTIRAIYSSLSVPVEGSITVTVVDGGFNGDPLSITQQTRTWNDSTFSTEISIEPDSRVVFEQASASGLTRNFNIRTDSTRDRYVWARLGDSGPVVATSIIRGLQVATVSSSGMFLEETFDDGVSSVRMPIVVSRVTEDMEVALNIFIGGVIFDDGTTSVELFAEDFDSTGIAFVRFYKAANKSATCHTTKVYQDELYIGRNK